MSVAVFCISFIGIIAYSNDRIKTILQYERRVFVITTILLIVLLISSIDRKIDIKRVTLNKTGMLFWTGWYLCFVFIFISSFKYYVREAYSLWGVLCITIFPMLLLIWQTRNDICSFYIMIARNMVLTLFVFLMINLTIVGYIARQEKVGLGYVGITGNPNSNGLIIAAFFTSALFLFFIDRNYRIVYFFAGAICIMFAFLSETQTTKVAMLAEVLTAVCIYFRNKVYDRIQLSLWKAIIAVTVAAVLCVVLGNYLYRLDWKDLNAYAADELEESYTEIKADEQLSRLNDISSGRIVLWNAYLKKVGVMGHGNPKGELFDGYEASMWAHNNALDIWYASGFPAFAGYLMWLLAGWIFVIKCIFAKKCTRKEYMLTVIAFVGYFIEAMLEITIYPMYTGIAFLAYITLAPVAFDTSEKELK